MCFFMILSVTACTKSTTENSYKAGTYTATAQGKNGDITVEVVFDESSIVSVKVLEHNETAGISDPAIERIPEEVVEKQTLAVDTVSGATYTSDAILSAIEDAVTQAGGNVDALKNNNGSDNASNKETELTTDVVVVGAGGAGLAAAASAHENGADVIVLEKLASPGGSTALSGGGISATGTRFQKEQGIEDSKESWVKLWKERQATSNPNGMYPDYDRLDTFMDEAVVTTEWLVDYVGHEYGSVTGFGMDPVKRIHFPKAKEGETANGSILTNNIADFLKSEGIDILTETPAKELITDAEGNVTGVIAENKDGKVIVNAKKVILATGGYAKNEELLKKFIPEAEGTSELSYASAGSTGDGMIMAEKVGATFYEEPWIIGVGIDSKIPGTGIGMDWTKVYVNGEGERFTNEQIHYAVATNALIEQQSSWLIFDSSDVNSKLVDTVEASSSTDEYVKADTLEALAESMNVPVDNLVNTMNTYNKGAKTGKDEMGKDKEYIVPVEKAPYYALKIYPKTMGTFAGAKTDENYCVLREDGTIINNLYAAGEMANKVLYNRVYMSGSSVQFALTSGRLAGENAAQNLE